MKRYTLQELFNSISDLFDFLCEWVEGFKSSLLFDYSNPDDDFAGVMDFVSGAVYGYFFDDLIAYPSKEEDEEGAMTEIRNIFGKRVGYDIAVKLPYWFTKYNEYKDLLVGSKNLMQTSKVTSSSTDKTESESGSLQKIATTPTGVSSGDSSDVIELTKQDETGGTQFTVDTDGFVDKYANTQQKYASANVVDGTRNGNILREGSIDELLSTLEKLPSSFANEVNRDLAKHFIFDYEGEERGYYNG